MLYLMAHRLLDWPKELHVPHEPNEALGESQPSPGASGSFCPSPFFFNCPNLRSAWVCFFLNFYEVLKGADYIHTSPCI